MPDLSTCSPAEALAALRWQVEIAGADEAVSEIPVDRTQVSTSPVPAAPRSLAVGRSETAPIAVSVAAPAVFQDFGAVPSSGGLLAIDDLAAVTAKARELAAKCQTLVELEDAVRAFDGCPLKRTAMNTVFADGNPAARLMLVGEAPGTDEDRLGRPFAGEAGQFLDRMLAAIGYDRSNTYITNMVFWRPPGNRNPSDPELMTCLPFVHRHIELVRPDVLVLMGAVSAKALLETSQGITRLRGQWMSFKSPGLENPVDAIPFFHPAYLMRSPGHKSLAWKDLLSIRERLESITQ